MEQTLGYVVFGVGWPVLIVGSIWAWNKSSVLSGSARTLLLIGLASFYVLGYTCTMYWLGQSWLVGVLPAFVAFFVLFIASLRTLAGTQAK